MDRREAVRNVALLMGAAISVTTMSMLMESCDSPADKTPSDKKPGSRFSAEQEATVAELVDTILPTTSTPGAKAAGVGPFVTMMIDECYPPDVQKMFLEGIEDLDKRSDKQFSKSFAAATADNRKVVLQDVVNEQKDKNAKAKPLAAGEKKESNFFQLTKELTMLGYFTSEIGATQALAYVAVPGKFESCTDMKPGQKAWAM